jgi:spermidine synthase
MDAVEFVRDLRGGITVVVGGQPQSYVDPSDPGHLAFEYVQHLAAVITATQPEAPARLAVTHIGGAGLTLARWLEHTRPGSPQVVHEPDAALTQRVRQELPLRRGHRIRVRAKGGREGLGDLRDASADVVVIDAFVGGRVPAELMTMECLREVARVLRPGGLLLLNTADEPGLRHTARVLAGVIGVFGRAVAPPRHITDHVALVAMHDVLKGRRFGNAVVAASAAPLDIEEMARQVARCAFPTAVRSGAELARLVAGARPLTDADGIPSPEAPDPAGWRVR